MRKFKTVFMRGGTSKGCFFYRSDLPENPAGWDETFLQAMGDPDPKQIDGLGGTVSSKQFQRKPHLDLAGITDEAFL